MKLVKLFLACSAVFVAWMSQASAATREWEFSFGIENFRWREFDNGAQALEESGFRYGLGFGVEFPVSADGQAVLSAVGKLYFGTVNYDGQTINLSTGARTPATSETNYDGLLVEASVARRYPQGPGKAFEVFSTAGIDAWTREIKSTSAASGYAEDWSVIYAAVGAGWRAPTYSARAGVKLPVLVDETVDFWSAELKPEGKVSLFLRLSAKLRQEPLNIWIVQAYYDSYRFDESDLVFGSTGFASGWVWQPESHQDVLGLQLLGRWH